MEFGPNSIPFVVVLAAIISAAYTVISITYWRNK